MALFTRKRSLLQSQRLVRRERTLMWFKISGAIVLFALCVWGLYILSALSQITVQTVLVSGNATVSTQDVLMTVREAIQGRYFLIFSKSNIAWYPQNKIAQDLKSKYLWIDNLQIERVGLNTIAIKIKERAPIAVWCGQKQEDAVSCKLIDAQGYVFAEAPDFVGNAYIKLYGPISQKDWQGSYFFNKTGLNHILDFIKKISDIGFQPVSVNLVTTTSYDVYMDSGARISVKVTDPVATVIANIDSLIYQKDISKLLYIDTRFGNKLFYKFK